MDLPNCTKFRLVCTISVIVVIFAAIWFHLAHHEHVVWPGKCIGVNLKIENGEIRTAQVEGGVLAIAATFPDQHVTKVIVYDYCQGKVLSSVETSR